jgi:hypothetical protein
MVRFHRILSRLTVHSSKRVERYGYVFPLIVVMLVASISVSGAAKPDHSPKRITEIVQGLEKQLGIDEGVEISIENANRLAFSVEPVEGRRDEFMISIDASFLDQLDEDDMAAAVAHELGHVWIFTHHPFLQTEALANQIAMRVVTRDSLKKLYAKLWTAEGTTGDLAELLGPDPSDR